MGGTGEREYRVWSIECRERQGAYVLKRGPDGMLGCLEVGRALRARRTDGSENRPYLRCNTVVTRSRPTPF